MTARNQPLSQKPPGIHSERKIRVPQPRTLEKPKALRRWRETSSLASNLPQSLAGLRKNPPSLETGGMPRHGETECAEVVSGKCFGMIVVNRLLNKRT